MLKLYNSLHRSKQDFIPIQPKQVSMYVCGMTVYDYCHLGHARVMVVFDMLARWLRASGYAVTYVRNITDIDDKIIQRANAQGTSIQQLTQTFIEAMDADSEKLGIVRPDLEPRATEHIGDMVSMITQLITKGFAYQASNGDVFFRVREFANYGQLSGKSIDALRAGERVDVEQAKQDPLDFVLWKSAKAGEPYWESPWGRGRPGWHIECSAMSAHHLGSHFDIHGGGQDLQFPHHENEIAQSEATHGCQMANYWLHNGFVRVDDEKMSKSLGNFFTIREVLEKYDAEVVRFFILRAHYRSPLNYSDKHLEDAKLALTRLYTALRDIDTQDVAVDWQHPSAQQFQAAMDDDLNTPEAIAVLFELANGVNKDKSPVNATLLKQLAGILGLCQRPPSQFLQGEASETTDIETAISARLAAKQAKNYAEADRIRQSLLAAGIVLEDTPQGTTWRRV